MPPKRRSARLSEAATSPPDKKKLKTTPSVPTKKPKQSSQPSASDREAKSAKAAKTVEDDARQPISDNEIALTPDAVPAGSKAISCLRSHPRASRPASLIFTHGAGGGLSAPAMMNFAEGFASTGSPIVCFQGSMNLKGRTAMFASVLDHEKAQSTTGSSSGSGNKAGIDSAKVAFGGRSMGARAAVLAAQADKSITTLVLVSYPLVGPKGDIRDQILLDLRAGVDVLFISGDRDSMCDMAQLAQTRAQMKAGSWMVVVEGADHGMNIQGGAKLKKGSQEVGRQTGKLAAGWIEKRNQRDRDMVLSWDGVREEVVIGAWEE